MNNILTNETKTEDTIITVYNIIAIKNTNQVKIYNKLQTVDTERKLIKDDEVSKYNLNIDDKNVEVVLYTCNLTESFILSQNKYPLFYANIVYKKNIKSDLLLRFVFYFKCDKQIKNITNNSYTGTFHLNLIVDNKVQELHNNNIYEGYEQTVEKIKDFINLPELSNIIKNLIITSDDAWNKKHNYYFESHKPVATINLKDYESDSD